MTAAMEAAADEMFDRAPPSDIAAEQCVLGGMLLSGAAIGDVEEVLAGRDFYRPAHQLVYETILELYGRGEPADAIMVAAELTKRGDIGRMGGAPYLHTLIASVPTASNAGYYARIVKERAILRHLVEAGTRIVQLGYSGDGDPGSLVDLAEAAVASVLAGQRADELATGEDLFMDALTRLESPVSTDNLIAPPWRDLRSLIPVFRPGQLVTVGGRPGTGKSMIASDLLRHVGLHLRLPVILFSLEMSRSEVADRVLSAETGVPLTHIQAGRIGERDWDRMCKARDLFGASKVRVDDKPGITLAHIRARMRAMARTDAARMVIVDYLQLMGTSGRGESRERDVAELVAGLKNIAREFAIPVVLLAQLNRGAELRTGKKPDKADLRESGATENDSDVVILIHRPDMSDADTRPGEADLIVDKNRAGPRGTRTVMFQGHLGRFVDMAGWTPTSVLQDAA